jgi:N6-adenosine-specific RNA methylase IME4
MKPKANRSGDVSQAGAAGYPVILADPPVPFEVWGKRPGGTDSRSAEAHYSTMSWLDLAALGPHIEAVAAPDCCLFLWVCQPLLVETIRMAEAWGFQYKTKALCWVKLRPAKGMTFHVGMGYWTRANTEDVLLFTRGSPRRVRKDVGQMLATLEASPDETPAIMAPLTRHSEKPPAAQDAIERLVDGPYLELFARRPRAGWRCLGNEIDGMDIRDALAAVAAEGAVAQTMMQEAA